MTRPGGRVLLSVMSLLGTSRRFLGALLDLARRHGSGVVDELFASHDQIGVIAEGHRFRYYTWASLQALLARHPCTLIDASAANFLAIGNNEELLEPLLQDHALICGTRIWPGRSSAADSQAPSTQVPTLSPWCRSVPLDDPWPHR